MKGIVVSFFIFFCFSSLISQTFDIGLNKYSFDGDVHAIVKDDDGSTYVGGSFTQVSLWSGHGVLFDGLGVQNPNYEKVAGGSIHVIVAIPGGGWYIGGNFSHVNGEPRSRLARINADGSLHAFDPKMNNSVGALAMDASGNLYAGGAFTIVGGSITRNRLCKFDNTGALTSFDPNMSGSVSALVLDGSENLYVGGNFTTVGGSTTRNYLCKFDNTGALTSFDPNMSSTVSALVLDGSGNLWAGGYFTTVGGSSTRNRLCKFDNTGALSSFDPNMSSSVTALVLDGSGNLYAGGSFTTVGGSARNRLCKFDNTGALTSFDPNMSSTVSALVLDGSGNLYAGGHFTTVGGSSARNRLCKFDNTGTLTSFDPNMSARVRALALDASGNLFTGGDFAAVGDGSTRNRLCKFDDSGTLTSFDPNMNNIVLSLALEGCGGGLYVGGAFTTVGVSNRKRLCKFDNSGALTSFNPNMSATVLALSLDGSGNLYAGGDFTTVGGSTRNRLCKFDDAGGLTSFNPDVSGSVIVLTLDGSGNLYAGGAFTTVGGSTRNRLCKFDDSGTLTSFNPNMSNSVYTLALDANGSLYAGGSFTTVEGSTMRNRLCKFDNTGSLTSFDPDMSSIVRVLALDASGNLYAGGDFTTVGGSTRNRLCKFDNTGALTSFDPNMSFSVNVLTIYGSSYLYAGGDFIGLSPHLAIFSLPCTIPTVSNPISASRCGEGTITLGATASSGGIKWYANATGGASLFAGTCFTTPSISTTTTYYAEAVDGSCVSAVRTAVIATINSIPDAPTGTAGQTFCGSGTVADLTATGTDIKWYDAATNGNLLTGTDALVTATSYFASQTENVNECESSSRFEVTATIGAIPTISSSTPASRCGSGAITLSATPSSGTISWFTASSGGTALVDDADYDLSGNDLTINNLSTTTTYYAEAVNGSCVSASRTVVIATINDCPTTLDGASCGKTLTSLSESVSCNTILGATNYKFEIRLASTNDYVSTSVTGSTNSFFRLSWLSSGIKYGTTYAITVSAYVDGAWQPYGNACNVTTPATSLNSTSCGKTLLTSDEVVNAFDVAEATNYKFEIRLASNNTLIGTSVRNSNDNWFRMSWVSGVLAGTTYSIKVSAYVAGAWQAYGPSCNVTTPATKLVDASCGINITDLAQTLNCYEVAGATDYRYEIRHVESNFYAQSVRGSANTNFRLSWVSGITSAKTYQVRVSAYVGGSWQAYGPACSITTAIPTTQLASGSCGASIPTMSTALYSDVVSGALNYRYQVMDGASLVGVSTRNAPDNMFRLSWLSGTALNKTYTIYVSVYANGMWGEYGTPCSVTTPAALVVEDGNGTLGAQLLNNFELSAYPNPSTGDFTIHSNLEGKYKVVNELGQVIRTFELGENNGLTYRVTEVVQGIYFISGTSTDGQITTTKVIVH